MTTETQINVPDGYEITGDWAEATDEVMYLMEVGGDWLHAPRAGSVAHLDRAVAVAVRELDLDEMFGARAPALPPGYVARGFEITDHPAPDDEVVYLVDADGHWRFARRTDQVDSATLDVALIVAARR